MSQWSRRKFFLTSLAAQRRRTVTNLFARKRMAPRASATPPLTRQAPANISSANGLNALDRRHGHPKKGRRHLDRQ